MFDESLQDLNKILDFLKTTPLCNLTYRQQCQLKIKRPTPKLSIKEAGKNRKRAFQYTWYNRFLWLTGCAERNKMFCYVCIIFGANDPEWCQEGISDLSNLIKKAVKHQSSKHHLLHSESFHMLGKTHINTVLSEAARLQAIKHNEAVSSNRQILKRLVQSIIFLSKQEIALSGNLQIESSYNKGNYLELLGLLAQNESLIREHLQPSSLLHETSSDIQNELILVTSYVLNEKIKLEINEAPFISIQIDETLDVGCKRQISIIIRYCVNDRIEERFVGFYDISKSKTAAEVSEVIRQVLHDWGVDDNKVVSQTYDGASLMTSKDGGVHKLVKQFCPHALLIHCYAHQLNLVLLHGSKSIRQVRLFVSALTAFHSFFKSSRRTVLLTEKDFKLPQANNTTGWNFHSRPVMTIIQKFSQLYSIFDEIILDESSIWDSESINSAIGLKRHMDDNIFVYLLCVFESCFVHIDPLLSILQSSAKSIATCHKEIFVAIRNIENLKKESFVDRCVEKSMQLNENLVYSAAMKDNLRRLAFEVIHAQTVQMKCRFEDLPHLEFIELVSENKFKDFSKAFPQEKMDSLLKQYQFFNFNQLQNELHNVYADVSKHVSPHKLLKYFTANGLDSIYQEITKLIRLVLTVPTATANERSISTLKRIKTYLRNSMNNDSILCFNSLAIEKKLLGELSSDPAFLEEVVDVFAEKKSRMELIYKVV